MNNPAKRLTIVQRYAQQAEEARRDRAGVFSVTIGDPADVMDYAAAGIKIDIAKMHLDESIPSGQLARTRNAYLLMRAGVDELGVWLRSRGVEV